MVRKSKPQVPTLKEKLDDIPEGYMARFRTIGYLYGSSDYPMLAGDDEDYGEPELHRSITGLEERLLNFHLKIFKPNGSIDVERTNRARRAYAVGHLPPIEGYNEQYSYRVIGKTPEELMEIKYTKKKPEVLVPLSGREHISRDAAAEYVGVNPELLERMVRHGRLKGLIRHRWVYVKLKDLNQTFALDSST